MFFEQLIRFQYFFEKKLNYKLIDQKKIKRGNAIVNNKHTHTQRYILLEKMRKHSTFCFFLIFINNSRTRVSFSGPQNAEFLSKYHVFF